MTNSRLDIRRAVSIQRILNTVILASIAGLVGCSGDMLADEESPQETDESESFCEECEPSWDDDVSGSPMSKDPSSDPSNSSDSGGPFSDSDDSRSSENVGDALELPIEVMGPDGTVVEVELPVEDPNRVESLVVRAHSIGYPYHLTDRYGYQVAKASFRLNDGDWIDITSDTVECLGPASRARCIEGPMHTLSFSIDASTLGSILDENRLGLRFNYARSNQGRGAVSMGYRILGLEWQDEAGESVASKPVHWDNPGSWTAPEGFEDRADEGRDLWYARNRLVDGWGSQETLWASCNDCHVNDAYDLQYFAYTNHSIVTRSEFHGLSKDEGKAIAAFVRSVALETEDGETYSPIGRPWNPPYQPGPTAAASRSDDEPRDSGLPFSALPSAFWAAGAGLEWELDEDSEVRDFLFPNGIDYSGHVTIDSSLNMRELPIALQMPDWNEWLPVHHPADVWGDDFLNSHAWDEYTNEFPNHAQSGSVQDVRRGIDSLYNGVKGNGPRDFSPGDTPGHHDFGIANLSKKQWALTKTFELVHGTDVERRAREVHGNGAEPLQWPGFSRIIFDQAPHITGGGHPKGPREGIMDTYHDAMWYQLQAIVNSGSGISTSLKPTDWKYHFAHIGAVNGVYGNQPWRYFANYMRLIQNAHGLDDTDSDHHPRGWYFRHVSIGHVERSQSWGKHLQRLSDPEYRSVVEIVLRAWNESILQEPIADWTRAEGQHGLEPNSWTPTVINGYIGSNKVRYADHVYTAAQKFAGQGIDPDALRPLTQWGEQLWPNANNPSWDQIVP